MDYVSEKHEIRSVICSGRFSRYKRLCSNLSRSRCFVVGGDHVMGPLHSLNDRMLDPRKSSGVAIDNGGRVTCSDLARIAADVQSRHGVAVLLCPPGDAAEEAYTDLV